MTHLCLSCVFISTHAIGSQMNGFNSSPIHRGEHLKSKMQSVSSSLCREPWMLGLLTLSVLQTILIGRYNNLTIS